jgi:hypothetical protein
MAATNFTPISLYHSTTASAVPSSGNLVAGELALNTLDEKLYFKNSAGTVKLLASNAASTGTVSSVAATVPAFLSIAGSPITTSGTLAITLSGTALPVANGGTGLTTTPANGALDIGNGTGFTRTTLTAGTGVTITNASGAITINATGTGGTVTSVAATVPSFLSIAGSPITTSGTLAFSLSGTALPTTSGGTGLTSFTSGGAVYATSTSALTTGTLPVASGGTGLTSLTAGYIPFGAGTSAFGNSANLFWDNTNTRLGVGTATPGATLHVYQNNASTSVMTGAYIQNISFTANTQAGIGLWAGDNFNAKVYTLRSGTSAGNLVFATNGGGGTAEANVLERVRIDSAGNVGIGTTSPADRLQVNKTAGGGITVVSSAQSSLRLANAANTNGFLLGRSLGSADTQDFFIYDLVASATRMAIDSAGNVGIGTTSPTQKLDVVGAVRLGTSGTDTYFSFGANKDIYLTYGNSAGGLFMRTDDGAVRATLNNSGNLGLGVTPSAWATNGKAFQVGNSAGFFSSSSLEATVTNNAFLNAGASAWVYINTAQASRYQQYQGVHSWFNAPSGTAGNAITFTQAMTLDASGRLLISTTSPTTPVSGASGGYLIEVTKNQNAFTEVLVQNTSVATAGQANYVSISDTVTTRFGSAGSGSAYRPASSGYVFVDGAYPLTFGTTGTERARISAAGGFSVGTTSDPGAGAIYATGAITAFFSDGRLKTVSGKIENALDKVAKLSGVYYTFNDTAKSYGYDSDEVQVGVLAQDVEAVLPQIVKAAPFDLDEHNNSKSGQNYKTVQYEKLVPLLIEAINELRAEVTALKGAI